VPVPISGRLAGLDRPTGAWPCPADQESGRPNSVSVPIFGPAQIIQYDNSKAAPWSQHCLLPEKQILTN